jgi:hypothetical protein
MAIKVQENFRFSEHKFAIPTGYGDRKRIYSPRLGVLGDTVEEMETKHVALGNLLASFTRADKSGRNMSDARFIEDSSTRAANLRTQEQILIVTVKNQQSGQKRTFVMPPIRDDMDVTTGSADMQALEDGLKANAAILVRLPGDAEDFPVPIDWVKIQPKVVEQEAAPAAPTGGLDGASGDDVLEIAEQEQTYPLVGGV